MTSEALSISNQPEEAPRATPDVVARRAEEHAITEEASRGISKIEKHLQDVSPEGVLDAANELNMHYARQQESVSRDLDSLVDSAADAAKRSLEDAGVPRVDTEPKPTTSRLSPSALAKIHDQYPGRDA